ncbi:MAG: tRNA uridine-5-carboxymethylaminomethyl(34) synthesis GTPase MnmE [Roseovarius sp.]
MDTIFALSTALGKAGVAIIRISGPHAHGAAMALCGTLPAPRRASVRALRDQAGEPLDEALVLVFEPLHSFTGEAVVEFQCHGSPAIIAAVLEALGENADLRAAEPGEFTRRALENGRLDLAQVEGLADLIEAETEAQRRQALRVFSGELGDMAESWRRDLIRAAALLEATIDFADEDVPVDVSPEVTQLVAQVQTSLQSQASGVQAAERVRAGFEVAIVGAPNVGKSTLLNALAGRKAAITSEYAGTTRDVIEVRMDLDGLPVTFLDTAGVRETDDVVEAIGVDLAKSRAERADLRVFLLEGDQVIDIKQESGDLMLFAKADLRDDPAGGISGQTGLGVASLVKAITETLSSRASGIGVATRLRHKQAMERALVHLNASADLVRIGEAATDIAAEEIRSAIRALDSLVGRIDVENILDEIFASFCLGK